MTMNGLALLLGLFGAPAALATLGHRFREQAPRQKRRFWGGVIGYVAGLALALSAMMVPPVWWEGSGPLREGAIHWSMLVGLLAGILVGTLLPGARGPRST
jgi:Mg/Co/Ni transporter MgtE